jgi:molecular chaperone GrpE (heat shock protein)
MPKYDLEKKSPKSCHRGCNKQFKEMKRASEESQAMLCEMKLRLRKQQLDYDEISQQLGLQQKAYDEISQQLGAQQKAYDEISQQLGAQQKAYDEISQQLESQQQAFAEISQQLSTQQEIMKLFYEEYQSLKKRQGRAQLMNYIKMRDSMIKDMAMYEEKYQTNAVGYKLLAMYVNDLTEILEDQSVEVLAGNPGKVFDPETQKPIERVEVYRPEQDNLVLKVYNCGYRWNGIMLKKMDVSVGVCRWK